MSGCSCNSSWHCQYDYITKNYSPKNGNDSSIYEYVELGTIFCKFSCSFIHLLYIESLDFFKTKRSKLSSGRVDIYCDGEPEVDIDIGDNGVVMLYDFTKKYECLLDKLKNVKYLGLNICEVIDQFTAPQNLKAVEVYDVENLSLCFGDAHVCFICDYEKLYDLKEKGYDIGTLEVLVPNDYSDVLFDTPQQDPFVVFNKMEKIVISMPAKEEEEHYVNIDWILKKNTEIIYLSTPYYNCDNVVLFMSRDELEECSLREVRKTDPELKYTVSIDGVKSRESKIRFKNILDRNSKYADNRRFKGIKPII